MNLEFFGKTDVGRKRDHNEDAFLLDESSRYAIVADGMGGHAAGEVASELAIKGVSSFINSIGEGDEITWPYRYDVNFSLDANKLIVGIKLANERILERVRAEGTLKGMGTTVVAALFSDSKVTVAHVGDSRAYLYRSGVLSIVTDDHSWVSEQVRRGLITEEQARVHPMKNVVTQALGGGDRLTVDVNEFDLQENDIVLLCSDGLNSMISHESIQEIFSKSSQSLEKLGDKLIETANGEGGEDNITIVLARALEST